MAEPVRSTIGRRDAAGVVRHGGEWLTLWADPDSVASPAERARAAQAGRLRERRDRALAATMRAIAGGPVPPVPADDRLSVARGRADDAALQQRHHDPALHARVAPADMRAAALFAALERARCRALGVAAMPGIETNLAAAMAWRLETLGLAQAHLAAQVPLVEALPMLALDALLGRTAPLLDGAAMRMWDRFAATRFRPALAALRPHVADQAAFAAAALEAVRAMFEAMQWDERPDRAPAPAVARLLLPTGADAELGADEAAGAVAPGAGDSAGPAAAPVPYRRFSTAFDRVVEAAEAAPAEELAALRVRLDRSMAEARTSAARLAHRLQRQIMAERLSRWSFDQDEGLLDTARLDRVVTRPGAALAFKRERAAPERDTAVALLIDNSGSMRGRPIALAAMAADLAAAALERCGVTVEVLGFTTEGWRGGRSARLWQHSGRPACPGRICDLRHVVYKSAGTAQRRSATALMLREDWLRENVDGEALLWAARRLRARPERRRLLLVISDGAPSDRATGDANDALYLERHLREVVAGLEASADIELSAIGIGHAVDRIYRDAAVVAGPDALPAALLRVLGRRLARQARSFQARAG